MRYDKHPTWRMLEEGKVQLRQLLNETPQWHPMFPVLDEAHRAIVKLQYALESKLCKE